MELKEDLLKRWEATHKIGFEKVRSRQHAIELIETIVALYENENSETRISLKDLAADLKFFILN